MIGDILKRRQNGLLWHYGVVVEEEPYVRVVHNSKLFSGVVETGVEGFALGRKVRKVGAAPSWEAAQERVRRARSCVGTRWRWGDNCEDLVSYACTGRRRSGQLEAWTTSGVVGVVTGLAAGPLVGLGFAALTRLALTGRVL